MEPSGLERVQQHLRLYEHPLVEFGARDKGETIEVAIRPRFAEPAVHTYFFELHPRDLDDPQFEWILQRHVFDAASDKEEAEQQLERSRQFAFTAQLSRAVGLIDRDPVRALEALDDEQFCPAPGFRLALPSPAQPSRVAPSIALGRKTPVLLVCKTCRVAQRIAARRLYRPGPDSPVEPGDVAARRFAVPGRNVRKTQRRTCSQENQWPESDISIDATLQ